MKEEDQLNKALALMRDRTDFKKRRYRHKLVIAGNIVKLMQYGYAQQSGKIVTQAQIDKMLESKSLRQEIRDRMYGEIAQFLAEHPGMTKGDVKLVGQLKGIVKDYVDGYGLESRRDSQVRREREVRELVNANFKLWSRFITLSFRKNLYDVDLAHKYFNNWLTKMRNKFPDFKYVAVREFQDRGALHYHLLCNLDKKSKADWDWLRLKSWTHKSGDLGNLHQASVYRKYDKEWAKKAKEQGFERAEDLAIWNFGQYLVSYMKKGAAEPRLFGKKLYFCSSGLDRPKEITEEKKIQEVFKALDLPEYHSKTYEVENEWIGKSTVTYYNLLRSKKDEYSTTD